MFPRDVRRIEVVSDGRTEGDAAGDLPVLHHSVKRRVDRVADYRPPALRDLRFRLWLGTRRLSAPIHGISGLRRYRFPWWRPRQGLGG